MFKSSALVVCLCLAVASANPVLKSGRIAGGIDAEEGQFPYQVSLRTASNNAHFCGGSVLNNRWIITAASCAQGKEPAGISVMAGSKSLTRGGSIHPVDRIIVHPNFDVTTLANDVAVMRVRVPFMLSPDILAVQMSSEYVSIAYGALVSGWGRRAMDSPTFPDWLQYVPVTIITNTECRVRFESPYDQRITDNTICSSAPVGRGACLGDAGGPLLHGGELQGVVSWGIPCGLGYPDVYARVSVHRPWVLVHTMV
ncbi:AAEL011917-PA [Aedes aegypti]|uniref:AAEL011917-PA n=1 Tax=Aedes aegypti TaxID=7159 RepID=Q16NM4_AEDAE|nr:AAEL011917-PA [Aedes aegypti]